MRVSFRFRRKWVWCLLLNADTGKNGTLREFLPAEQGLPEKEKKKIFVNICLYAYDNNAKAKLPAIRVMDRREFEYTEGFIY